MAVVYGHEEEEEEEEEEEYEEYVPVRKRRALELETRRSRLKSSVQGGSAEAPGQTPQHHENGKGTESAVPAAASSDAVPPSATAPDAVPDQVYAAAAPSSLLLQQQHRSANAVQETEAEVARREEEELLKSIGGNKQALQSVKELAHSITYNEPMKTLNWTAPKDVLAKGKELRVLKILNMRLNTYIFQ